MLDLGFTHPGPGFQSEGLAYNADGEPIKGIEPRNTYLPVDGSEVLYYLEAAGNPTILDFHPFLPTPLGDKDTAGTEPLYKILKAELAVFQPQVWHLMLDIEVLQSLMKELQPHDPRRHKILHALDRAMDALDLNAVADTADLARAELEHVLSLPASASAHKVSAIGHAHIDSAWLWPLRETVRKCARTFSNVTKLMDAVSGLLLRVLAGAAVRVDEGPPPARVGPGPREGPQVDSSCRSAACGSSRTRTCPAVRRWPASSCTASASSWTTSAWRPRRSGCPTRSATAPRSPS